MAAVVRPVTAEVEPPPSSRRDLLTPAAIALTLVPLVVLAAHMLRSDVHLSADLATTEMRTRDVGSRWPSLGPYSRDGWFHPGPTLFYVLAPSYRLFGTDGSAMAVGAVVVNAVSVGAMGMLARRRGGTGLLLSTLLGLGLLMHALGPTFLATPWNVYITVLPYGALLFTVWGVVAGERWALPAATFVTSFLMQTHVGYVALALPLLAAAAAWAVGRAVVDRRRHRGAGRNSPEAAGTDGADATPSSNGEATDPPVASTGGLLGPLVASAAVAIVMWLPPVVQQATHAEGNIDRIVEWFREGDDEARTLLEGWRVVADQYTVPPEWVAGQAPLALGNEPSAVHDGVVPVLLAPVLAAAGYLWWRRRGSARALVATWAAASAVAVVATSRTVGPLYAYRLHWAWVLGMLGGVLAGWAAWTLVTGRGRARARARAVSVPVALAALTAVTVATTVEALRAEQPGADAGAVVAGLVSDTEVALAEIPGDDPVLVRTASFGAIGVGLGLVNELESSRVDTVIEDAGAGEHRRHEDGDPLRATLLVVVDTDIVPALAIPEHEMIAFTGVDMERLEAQAAADERLERAAADGSLTADELRRAGEERLAPYSAGAVFLVAGSPEP